MKYITLLLLMSIGITSTASDRLKVVASASMIADITAAIAGDLVDIDMIVPIGGDPHIYEPTPSDVRLVHDADLVLINGLTFEGWITELIENSGTEAPTVVVTDGINVLTSQTYENSADPHAWMDANNGLIYAKNIATAIISIDPANAQIYQENLKRYQEELKRLDQYIQGKISSIPPAKRVLVTSHDAFQYFGRRYGIRLEAIMGVSTDAEAQTSDIRRVAQTIKESGIPAIFVESTINPKLIKQLAQDSGIKVGGQLYADSLGDEDSPAATYIQMLRHNVDTIVDALTSEEPKENQKEKSGGLPMYIFGLAALLGVSLLIMVINANRS